MIRAYHENYLYRAMHTLARLFELALYEGGFEADEFAQLFASSRIAKNWEVGEPNTIAGHSGAELYFMLTDKEPHPLAFNPDRTDAYWAGWVLCYSQWYLMRQFSDIFHGISLSELLSKYPTLHEADITKTCALIESRISPIPMLSLYRRRAGLSQSQLARESGVNIRSIKAYEQGELSLLKAQYETLLMLSRVLRCEPGDLV